MYIFLPSPTLDIRDYDSIDIASPNTIFPAGIYFLVVTGTVYFQKQFCIFVTAGDILGQLTFDQVVAQVGDKSFKGSMKILADSLRNIADSFLHRHIRRKEVLPTQNQIKFQPELERLLGEIIEKLSDV